MTTENDYLNAIDCAKKCGWQEGRMEGRAETARRMKDDGMPADVISKYTGLSENRSVLCNESVKRQKDMNIK